ncbi:MAG: hypothetical protein H8E37_03210 [Planctomycetes bacterium]|nr:hypothetical protein [Planctomycetota bacterium]
MRLATLSCLACSILAASLSAVFAEEDPVFSGPQVGEKLPSFKIRNVLAEPAEDVDLIKAADGKPVVIVFVHKRTRPAFGLTNALMNYAQTRKKAGLTSGVAFLTADATETGNWMKKIRNYFPKGATYGVSPDGLEGPGAYGLNRDVTLTILMGKDNKATANFALVQPGMEADGPKIAKALASLLGDKKPVDLVKFSRSRMSDKAKRKRPAANTRPGQQLPEAIVAKLRAVISKENSPEDVDKAAKALEEALAKDEKSARQIGVITNRIIDGGVLERYGTKKAREYLKKWAKEFAPKKKPESDKPADERKKPARGEKPAAEKAGSKKAE